MALTPHEQIRNRREREFQSRMLAAVEKPKQSTTGVVAKVLNSPFTLWLLSAILITVGGAFFSTRQQCIADAEKVIESAAKLDSEIARRQRYIFRSIVAAETVAELKDALAKMPTLYADFAGRSLFELLDQEIEWLERLTTAIPRTRIVGRTNGTRFSLGSAQLTTQRSTPFSLDFRSTIRIPADLRI
jgi:hypothetical protein